MKKGKDKDGRGKKRRHIQTRKNKKSNKKRKQNKRKTLRNKKNQTGGHETKEAFCVVS
jgi:hypothetical protein